MRLGRLLSILEKVVRWLIDYPKKEAASGYALINAVQHENVVERFKVTLAKLLLEPDDEQLSRVCDLLDKEALV